MVCDVAVASTVVSLVMNGFCCMWQQQEEKEMREAIRRDIRVEYWNQRLMDQELRMRQVGERRVVRHSDDDSSLVQDERRKNLMLAKMNASSDSRKQVESPKSNDKPVSTASVITVSPQTFPREKKYFPHTMNCRRAHSLPLVRPTFDKTMLGGSGPTTSLVDNDDDTDDDDEQNDSVSSSFSEVFLR